MPKKGWTGTSGEPSFEGNDNVAIDEDIYVVRVGPHMGYGGKAMRYEVECAEGEREALVWVPDYDFNWQFLYEYKEPKFLPAGSVMHLSWWFDNSSANRFNPDPTMDVVYGPETTDEMANARIDYAPTAKRGIVVGEDLPRDVLETARKAEQQRRENSELLVLGEDDTSWLLEE